MYINKSYLTTRDEKEESLPGLSRLPSLFSSLSPRNQVDSAETGVSLLGLWKQYSSLG